MKNAFLLAEAGLNGLNKIKAEGAANANAPNIKALLDLRHYLFSPAETDQGHMDRAMGQ